MGDSKTLLKEARDAIKNKNFDLSLRLCKQVLREDKENYTALVFLGATYHESRQSDKAEKAFKAAIKLNSSNPLAWHGLINHYEKLDGKEAKTELVASYLQILKHEVNDKKLIETVEKLCRLQEFGETWNIVSSIYTLINSGKCAEKARLWVPVVEMLSKETLSTDLLSIYEQGLHFLVNNKDTTSIAFYAEYLNLLYKQNKLPELLEHAKKMRSIFETDSISLKWICKVFNEIYVESNHLTESPETMQNFCEDLLKVESNSPTALFTKSIILMQDNDLLEAKNLLRQVVTSLSGLLHAWILLLKCCAKLSHFEEAVQAAVKIDKLLKSASDSKKRLRNDVDMFLIEALANSSEGENLQRVLNIYETLDDDAKSKTIQHVIRANILLENYAKAEQLLASIKDNADLKIVYKLLSVELLHTQKRFDEALQMVTTENIEDSEWFIKTGIVHWDMGNKAASLIPFLKAAKINPNNYKCFLHLGHYYRDFNDSNKARRCYEKSFKLNNRCSEAGVELSKIYRKNQNWDANFALLESLTKEVITKKNSWAWLQLGLSYLEQEDSVNAIKSLRSVIRVDEENIYCWESLADAYLAKGAYTSALKCYEKAAEISPTALYPLLQLSSIKLILGEYTEAREDFDHILSTNGAYVPALKGLAEACLSLAKSCLRDQRFGTSRDHVQKAVEQLILAIQQRSELSCLWKLLGDSCFFIAKLPQKYSFLAVPAGFLGESETKILHTKDLFNLSSKCFCKSIATADDNILIWHDLATCYLAHAVFAKSKDISASDLLVRAKEAVQYCCFKNPTYWPHWNLLGNVAIQSSPPDYRLAQHAFIKSVIAENNSAISWCNLGTLYLVLDDMRLANEAFSQAQRSDPNYVNSWIGQALLAENLAHADAMDLFRHSTQLGMHEQGALGYANWVCKTLKQSPIDAEIYSIHNMHAIPVACDALTFFVEKNPRDSSAWNMLGILRERMGLKQGAVEAFKKSLDLANTESHKDFARVNYGRLLEKVGNNSEAIQVFADVKSATFNSGTGLALALFKSEFYKESYEAYESALHWLTDDQNLQSDLLVALASMAYMFDGTDAAKTLLFQSIQLENPSPWGFYATLAMGLLNNDLNLAELVYTEMDKLRTRKDCLGNIAILSAYMFLLKGNPKSALLEVEKIIHLHPDHASPWLTLSSLLVRVQTQKGAFKVKAAAKCAQAAMHLGQTNMDVTKVLCLVSVSSLLIKDFTCALTTAQKAVHCYPNIAETWSVLSAALLATKKLHSSLIRNFLKHVELLSNSDALANWMQKTIRLI